MYNTLINNTATFNDTNATSSEESKGIDGYIEDVPVSIKPDTYKTKDALQEKIEAPIIYYKKTSKYLHIYLEELQKHLALKKHKLSKYFEE